MRLIPASREVRKIGFVLLMLVGLMPLAGALAQGDSKPAATAKTTADPKVPADRLHVMLRPLIKEELEVELTGWIELLRAKILEVGDIELKLKALPKGESDKELSEQLVTLRTEETDLAERARIVIAALKSKGGEAEATEQFIAAISDITETTDATSFWAATVASVKNWAGREDGGELWAKRGTLALVIFIFAWLISKFAGRLMSKAIARHPRTSQLLENFAGRTAGGIVFVVGVLMALSALGVQIGPMMAALGAGGFIVGFALQETLGSFASGLMIMVYRPFDVDDYVTVAGVSGTVKEMSLVSTTLLTVDNKVLIIPNKKAWADTITNYTGKNIRRVDLVFGIGYEDDIQQSIDVLTEIASEHKLVLADPPVSVNVDQLADSSVNIFCRPWVNTTDYWTVHSDLTRQVKERFDAEGISIPFPQRDVHMHSESPVT